MKGVDREEIESAAGGNLLGFIGIQPNMVTTTSLIFGCACSDSQLYCNPCWQRRAKVQESNVSSTEHHDAV